MKGTSHDGHRTNGRHVAHTDTTNSDTTHLDTISTDWPHTDRPHDDGTHATAVEPRWRVDSTPRRR